MVLCSLQDAFDSTRVDVINGMRDSLLSLQCFGVKFIPFGLCHLWRHDNEGEKFEDGVMMVKGSRSGVKCDDGGSEDTSIHP